MEPPRPTESVNSVAHCGPQELGLVKRAKKRKSSQDNDDFDDRDDRPSVSSKKISEKKLKRDSNSKTVAENKKKSLKLLRDLHEMQQQCLTQARVIAYWKQWSTDPKEQQQKDHDQKQDIIIPSCEKWKNQHFIPQWVASQIYQLPNNLKCQLLWDAKKTSIKSLFLIWKLLRCPLQLGATGSITNDWDLTKAFMSTPKDNILSFLPALVKDPEVIAYMGDCLIYLYLHIIHIISLSAVSGDNGPSSYSMTDLLFNRDVQNALVHLSFKLSFQQVHKFVIPPEVLARLRYDNFPLASNVFKSDCCVFRPGQKVPLHTEFWGDHVLYELFDDVATHRGAPWLNYLPEMLKYAGLKMRGLHELVSPKNFETRLSGRRRIAPNANTDTKQKQKQKLDGPGFKQITSELLASEKSQSGFPEFRSVTKLSSSLQARLLTDMSQRFSSLEMQTIFALILKDSVVRQRAWNELLFESNFLAYLHFLHNPKHWFVALQILSGPSSKTGLCSCLGQKDVHTATQKNRNHQQHSKHNIIQIDSERHNACTSIHQPMSYCCPLFRPQMTLRHRIQNRKEIIQAMLHFYDLKPDPKLDLTRNVEPIGGKIKESPQYYFMFSSLWDHDFDVCRSECLMDNGQIVSITHSFLLLYFYAKTHQIECFTTQEIWEWLHVAHHLYSCIPRGRTTDAESIKILKTACIGANTLLMAYEQSVSPGIGILEPRASSDSKKQETPVSEWLRILHQTRLDSKHPLYPAKETLIVIYRIIFNLVRPQFQFMEKITTS